MPFLELHSKYAAISEGRVVAPSLAEVFSNALNTKSLLLTTRGRRREAMALLRHALEVALENDKPSAAMRAYNAGEAKRPMRSWTLPFLIRHSAFHTLDHAWEMEDKDLS